MAKTSSHSNKSEPSNPQLDNSVPNHSDTEQQLSSKAIYKRLLGYTKRYKMVFLVGVLANILFALVETSFVNAIQFLIDKGIEGKDRHFLLVQTPLFILGALILRGVFNFISTYCMGWVGRKVVQRLREQLYEHFVRLPASFFSKRNTGSMLSTLTFNTEQVAVASSDAITLALRSVGMVVFILMYMLLISWRLTLFIMILVPFISLVISISSRRLKKVSNNIQSVVGDVTHAAEESLKANQVIKMFGGVEREIAQFNIRANRNRQQDMKLIATKGIASPVIQTIAGLGFSAIVYFGSLEMLEGRIAPGQLVTYITLMALILRPLKEITIVNTHLQRGIAGAQSIFKIIDLPTEIDEGTHVIERAKGHVEFNKVNFSYESEKSAKQILSEVSFSVDEGKTIALVGRSGSGKTTIANLLQRFYQIDSGCITIDGHDIREVTLTSLRKQIASVSQNVVLFNQSIRYNIAYADPDNANDEAIEEAAKNAFAWDFIQELPEGLDTVIGDNGASLSGGQRQRLAIARAMYKDAPILILDEATSALDTESERHIQKALENLMKNRTTLVVAHRLSTIEKADEILVVDQGRIVERGSHSELLANNGEYTRLHQMQFSES